LWESTKVKSLFLVPGWKATLNVCGGGGGEKRWAPKEGGGEPRQPRTSKALLSIRLNPLAKTQLEVWGKNIDKGGRGTKMEKSTSTQKKE